jgi:hypothetical protein
VIEKEKEEKERKKEECQERYERDESSERKIKCKDVTLLRDETSTLFPTMCNPTTRTSSVPRSHIFFCPCTCPPLYTFSSLISPHMVYSHDHWL